MQKSNKPESSRLNIFYIIHVLQRYSDREHAISASEIQEKVNQEFGYLSSSDSLISVDTVKRTLDELIECVFPKQANVMEYESNYGFWIGCLNQNKKYYFYESALREAELLTLKDAIETYSYFSEEDITEIVRKMVRIRPCSFPKQRYYDVAKNDRDEDSLLLMNIDELNEIIQRRNGANITYCAYDIDKKLVPRPGYPRFVEPLHLMWSNGYYYLLAYYEKYQNIVSYRVDRITDIEEVEQEHSRRKDSFNPVLYRHEHPVMYGGKKERIVMLCRDTGKNYIMNTIMDVFGKNAKVTMADSEMIRKYLPESSTDYAKQGITWLKVMIETTTGGAELWATQYANDCRIVAPETLAKRVKERLANGLKNYN